mmetsp:Transcript_15477/g.27431  ORF Transcript_15477/g.27431 Transcript_15477/m.27431 type:complete len:246 (+) Transcript_15477:49-786(+)|eukprot:CAMPEP_0205920720 /NCGR_PEP_ID=MMETSP1325-20131115/11644_1 /ASSEMBLY_ACC=CAM_ASM_000708 /TAXON_ID=236786 /ORGANISM="Florenciella sp., Strain RCC1007" /LENGTH=245 /DNA_ID=CAMNT_0053288441 /DNA_START=49 /DNA_END=786 /DNA_ORIENTATION=+
MAGMMEAEPDWSRLSKASGIDLMALRTKYQNMKAQGLTQGGSGLSSVPSEYGGTKPVDYGAVTPLTSSSSSSSSSADEPPMPSYDEQKMQRVEQLDMIHVCHICHGTGIETYEYMHMSRQRNCETCDGEGTITRKKVGVGQHVDMPLRGGTPEARAAEAATAAAATDESAHTSGAAAVASNSTATAASATTIAIELDDEEEEEEEGGKEALGRRGGVQSNGVTDIAIVMDEEDSEDEGDDVPDPN